MPFLTKLGVNLPTPTPSALPGNVVVFYSPTVTPVVAPTGWENYTGLDGYIISGGSQSNIPGTVLNAPNNVTADARPLYSAGSHTGPFFSSHVWNGPGSGWPNSASSAGSHNHGWVSYQFQLRPRTVRFHTLRATQPIARLPEGAVIIKETAPTLTASTSISYSDYRYIYALNNAAGSTDSGNTSQWVSNASPTAGSHFHDVGSNRGLNVPTPFSPVPSTRSSGNHFHAVNVQATGTRYNGTRVVRLYRLSAEAELETGMIVGTTAGWGTTLPDNWAWCDGTNGTLNLFNTFPCLNSSLAYGDAVTSDVTAFVQSVSTSGDNFQSDMYHSHTSPGFNQPPTPVSLMHSFTWVPHSHSWDLQFSSGTVGSRGYLGFIQYLG